MVQVNVKNDKSKRSSWSAPQIILSIGDEAGSVVVPERGGKRISEAFEDLRFVPCEDRCLHLFIQLLMNVTLPLMNCSMFSPLSIGRLHAKRKVLEMVVAWSFVTFQGKCQ